MSTLRIRVNNARREPLDDRFDLKIVRHRTNRTVRTIRDVPGRRPVRVDGLTPREPYIVRVFPARHRPVGQFVIPGDDDTTVQMYAPLDPERVRSVRFPPYADLSPELRDVLDRSVVEGLDASGEDLYTGLTDLQKAALFNLFSKMSTFGFDDARTVWSGVDRVYRIRPDRIFADVHVGLRDLVKGAVVDERFSEVSGSLHTPPPGFEPAGSFKTTEQYGNLQLTFFASTAVPLAFRVDADIDNAAGLGHAFQVLRNWVTQGTTHPYDIHQILVFRQEVVLPYELA